MWELAQHRSVYVVRRPEHSGHTARTVFVDDLDALVARVVGPGVEPSKRKAYPNSVRTVTYHDSDAN